MTTWEGRLLTCGLSDDAGDFIQALPYPHAYALESDGEIRGAFSNRWEDSFPFGDQFRTHRHDGFTRDSLHLVPVSIRDLNTGEMLVESSLKR